MLHGRVVEEIDAKNEQPKHPYSRVLFDPWAGPLPDFDDWNDDESLPKDAQVCNDEEVETEGIAGREE